jgi:hypothetical protein
VSLGDVLEVVQPNRVGGSGGYISLSKAEVKVMMQPPSVQTQPAAEPGAASQAP